MRRVKQQTLSHCGPAVAVMLASFYGIDLRQNAIVEAVHAESKLRRYGMTVQQLGEAISLLAPQFRFYMKEHASIDDLDYLVNQLLIPVGVEWQGVFGWDADDDNGHYSVVTRLNRLTNTISLSDPYFNDRGIDRKFPIDEFENRWWDENALFLPGSKKPAYVKDTRMLFFVSIPSVEFPPERKFIPYRECAIPAGSDSGE